MGKVIRKVAPVIRKVVSTCTNKMESKIRWSVTLLNFTSANKTIVVE